MLRVTHYLCVILLTLLVISPILPPALGQQDARGTVVGRVVDSTGAVIPGAEVRVTNVATGVAASAQTNESGLYAAPYLIPGTYTVTAELTGFKRFARENVQVRVGDRIELEIVLQIGDVSESVQVTAETPLLATSEVSLGQVVDERRINELPLFAGNAMDLVHLAPGIMNGTDMRLRKAPFNNAPSQFSSDGNANYNNEFTIDGVSNTYSDGTSPRVAFSPPAASIAEFKVQTTAYDASVGHTQGALVNVATKGGTNDLHGSAWWWLRHSMFDAPTLFQNRAGQKLPIYQDNRYGIAGGAPVYVPGVYNGKNKTFWFFTFEGNKFGDPNVGGSMTSTVPREAWRDGNFSDLLALGSSYQLYDPMTIAPAAGGRFSRQPLAGNVIPASRLNPVGRNLLNLYPLPNNVGAETADGRNNFFYSLPAKENYWTTIGRVDHAFSDTHRMFVRFHRDYWEEDKNRSFGNDINGIILNRVNRGLAMDQVYVFSPTFLFNFRYGLTQQEFPQRRVSSGFDLASLGFSDNVTSLVDSRLSTVPRTAVGSLTTLSSWEGAGDGVTASLTHSFVGNFTWLRGAHNLRFGPEYRVYREFMNRYPAQIAPDLSFSNAWARGPLDNSVAPPVGSEMAAALFGIPGGSMTLAGSHAEQDQYVGLYIQDDWKVSSKLTLNLGLRLEHETPITERFNRSATRFFGTTSNPIEEQARANYASRQIPELPLDQFRVLGGYGFAGVGGQSRSYWEGRFLTWMPRIGLAYQFTPKTVLRAGYGMFYGSIGVNKSNSNLAGFSQNTPIQPSLDNGLTYIATLESPFPSGLRPIQGAAGGMLTNLNQNLTFFPEQRSQPYAQRWSIGIQRELPEGFVIENSYVANRGVRLPTTQHINATPAQYLSTSPTRDQATINFLSANFPSPFSGIPAPTAYGANMSRGRLLQPYPQFGTISFLDQNGASWYHSLQTRLEKRFSRGYTLQASYTWSKAMEATEYLNNADFLPHEVISSFDRTHRITGSGQWELPFGRNRKWGASMHPALNFFAGGWQLNGVVQRQSGGPLGFGQALFVGNSADIVLPSSQRNADRWFNINVFDTVVPGTATATVANGRRLEQNLRTSPLRYSNIRTDSQRRWDFSAIKYFKMGERFTWQFRAETYNALNEVVLRGPTTDPYNANFGRITGQEPPRSWQMALRLTF
jgi:hypothetical protein